MATTADGAGETTALDYIYAFSQVGADWASAVLRRPVPVSTPTATRPGVPADRQAVATSAYPVLAGLATNPLVWLILAVLVVVTLVLVL
jgi:hypothetical protein